MEYDFSEVLVYLCDPQTHIRKDIRAALLGYGFEMIEDFREYEELEEQLDSGELPDLIICDADVDEGRPVRLMSKIRRNEFGDNPFIACIMMTWNPTPQSVRAITNSGVDDLLGKPVSPKQLMERVKALITSRKPFVVTADYIGPDRRKASSRPSNAKSFEVPNTLAARSMGEEIPDIGQAIHDTWSHINFERQSRNAFQLAFLVNLIHPALATNKVDAETIGHINRLVETCADAAARMRGGQFKHVADLFKRLTVVAKAIQLNPLDPGRKNIDLLQPLTKAINKAMNPDKDEAHLAAEISGALEKFSNRATTKKK